MSKKKSISIKKEDKVNIILLIPVMLILAIIPLIVYLKVIPNDEATRVFMGGQENNVDFFSYYKSIWFVGLTGIGLFMYLSQVFLDRNIKLKKDPIYYPMIAYGVLIILSTVFATYRTVAFRGFMDRYEGIWVLLSYLGVMFLSYNLVNNEKQLKYIFGSLGFSTLIMSIIGFTQYIGKDVFRTNFMKKLITPAVYSNQIDNINFTFEANRVYASLYNPNYVGVYSTMIFSLSTTIMLLTKNKLLKLMSGFISVMSMFMLLGSGSRAGMLTLVLYFIFLCIIFRTLILKKKKITLVVFSAFLILLVGANIYSNNIVFNRLISGVSSLINKEEPYDFKNLYTKDNSLLIEFQDYILEIEHTNGNLGFYDTNREILDLEQTGNILKLVDSRYNLHEFEVVSIEDEHGLIIKLHTNRDVIFIKTKLLQFNGIALLDNMNRVVVPYKAPYYGFEGREKLASNRGYIWSRSIPMLKNTIMIGYGPDTYGLHYPNDDYYGKLVGLSLHQQVDKPHSLYLQIALNTGILSLLSFILLILIYLHKSIKIYLNKHEYSTLPEITGLAIFFAVLIYLITGLSNDSVVAISPMFWTILGIGHKLNTYKI